MDDKKYGKADIFSGKLSEVKGLKLKVTNVYLRLNKEQAIALMEDIYDNGAILFQFYTNREN